MTKKIVIAFTFLLSCFHLSTAAAVDPIFTPVFSDLAIRGYDTVAYFTQNKAVKGDKAIAHDYKGAKWLFSSKENKALFIAEPSKYAPQYGGYCAYAVSQGSTASIEPEQFTVLNGKLYLNYSKKVNDLWTKDRDNFIVDADKNWPSLID